MAVLGSLYCPTSVSSLFVLPEPPKDLEELDFEDLLQSLEQNPPRTIEDLSHCLPKINHIIEWLHHEIKAFKKIGLRELKSVDTIERILHLFSKDECPADILCAQVKFESFKNWVRFWGEYFPVSQSLEERVCDLNDYSQCLQISRASLSLNCCRTVIESCLDVIAIFQKFSDKIEQQSLRVDILKVLHDDLKLALEAQDQFWPEYEDSLSAEIAEAQAYLKQCDQNDLEKSRLVFDYFQKKSLEMAQFTREFIDRFPSKLNQESVGSSWYSTFALIGGYIRSPSTLFIPSSVEIATRANDQLFLLYRQFLSHLKDRADSVHFSVLELPFVEDELKQLIQSRPVISKAMHLHQNRQIQTKIEWEREMPLWKKRMLGSFFLGLHGGAVIGDVYQTVKKAFEIPKFSESEAEILPTAPDPEVRQRPVQNTTVCSDWTEQLSFNPSRPNRSYPIKTKEAQNWVEAHASCGSNATKVAQAFIDATRHVPHEEFERELKKSTDKFNVWLDQQDSKDYLLVVSKKGKSNRWVAELSLKNLKVLPVEVMQSHDSAFHLNEMFMQYMKNHPHVKHLVFFDDAAYSCSQTKRAVCEMSLIDWYSQCRTLDYNKGCSSEKEAEILNSKKNYSISVIIPYMRDPGCVLMKSAVKTTCYPLPTDDSHIQVFTSQKLYTLREKIGEELSREFWKIFGWNADKIPAYFDHKLADFLSTYDEIYKDGTVTDCRDWRHITDKPTKFIDDIHPPYK
jgi:hypothetical protein